MSDIKVRLVDSMGSDLRIVNAARVSYAKQSEWVYACQCLDCPMYSTRRDCKHSLCGHVASIARLKEADKGLINYLMRERHGTPFEMVVFTFHIECPIFVAREWQRHRIGSYNEVSTRYVEMEPDFYVPDWKAVRTQVGKPGHYTYKPLGDGTYSAVRKMEMAYADAYAVYKELLELGVARELARNVLPLGLMTQFYWTVNLRSLFNFLSLRLGASALLEIRKAAEKVYEASAHVAPVAFQAWEDHGMKAP